MSAFDRIIGYDSVKKEVDSFDVLWDEDKNCHCFNDKKLRLDEPWSTEDEIFAFDTGLFASFDSCVDSSD